MSNKNNAHKSENAQQPQEMRKWLQCEQCDFKLTSQTHLNRHKEMQHEAKSNKCEQCEFKSTSKTQLKRHKEMQHEAKSNKCEQCDFKSTSKIQLNRHKVMQHETKSYNDMKSSKRKICIICDKKFNKDSTYDRHMRKEHKEGHYK